MDFENMDFENMHSSAAEQGLIGILLIFPDRFNDVVGIVKASDFYYKIHSDIFSKIEEFTLDGKAVSPVSLKPYFDSREDMEPAYLAELAGSIVSGINVVSYAEVIKNYAQKRHFLELIDEMKARAIECDDINFIKNELSGRLESKEKSIFLKDKMEVQQQVLQALTQKTECYNIGLKKLNKLMGGGLYAGFTYGIAGAEKSGKTTIAQTISYNLNEAGVDHAYIALEMGSMQIEQRNIARKIQVNSLAFLGDDKIKYVKSVTEAIAATPRHTVYLDMAGCNFNQIKSQIINLVSQKKIKGFILDYWQLIAGCDIKQNMSEFLFEIAQWCAGYCRRNNIWCIILSQLNRNGKLLGSAGLERACDQLYLLKEAQGFYGDGMFITLTHSRYTPTAQLGDEENPAFEINKKSGPYLLEI